MRVALLTPNFENNSLGRTYCLWLLARHLGWDVSVHGVKGRSLWPPLATGEFADACVLPGQGDGLGRALRDADVVVAIKPLPSSFGVALREAHGTPVVLDMDDPDIEVRTVWSPLRQRIRDLARRPGWYRAIRSYRRLARQVPLIVSNPELQRMYGGTVVPHVRIPDDPLPYGGGAATIVRFVGSPRGHKGVDVLRRAVADLASDGFTLEITAEPPADAAPWERWIGGTSMAEGARLVRSADIVAIPSLDASWARAQLPAKLIDAMIAGRAIVASDLPPVAWALGGAGVLVPPDDPAALTAALRGLVNPVRRADLGAAARTRALEAFTVEAAAPDFERVVLTAVRSSGRVPA